MNSKHWELVAKYLSGKTTLEEEKELFIWVKQNPENEEVFKHSQSLWKNLPGELEEYTPDTEKRWEELKKELLKEDHHNPIKSIKADPTWWWAAASILLILGIGYLLFFNPSNETTKLKSIATKDNINVFYLPDSSLIWLNKNSRISFPEYKQASERIVYLQGEAFFKVKRDSLRPFKIFTDSCVTTVLGTSFNIKAYDKDENVEVTVATGKVNLSLIKDTVKDHILFLKPHDKGIYNKKENTVNQQKNNDPNYTAWKGNLIDLKKTVLYQNESTNISSYLNNDSKWRQNLLKQTIIEGELDNNANLVTYKNIKFKVIYYSHGGHKLATKYFMINSVIGPGNTIVYSYKLNHWFSNTTKVIVEVEEADIFEKETIKEAKIKK